MLPPALPGDCDEIDGSIPVAHLQIPGLPGPKVVFNVTGRMASHHAGLVVREILAEVVAMRILAVGAGRSTPP